MRRFPGCAIDVLVATTVIEVGIDVANATVMLIEHPDGSPVPAASAAGRVGLAPMRPSAFCWD